MKKSLIALLCIALTVALPTSAQKLVELYKKGTIRLVPDKTFAQGNDWNTVFRSYENSSSGRYNEARVSIVLLPEGSLIISHSLPNYFTMFNPQGKFVKEFKLKNKQGKAFSVDEPKLGIINGNTIFCGIGNTGNLYCFDYNGIILKKLKLNHEINQSLALPNRMFAVVGSSYSKGISNDFVSLVNYDTNEEKKIWEHQSGISNTYWSSDADKTKRPLFTYGYSPKSGGTMVMGIGFEGASASVLPPIIAYSSDKLLFAFPGNGDLWEYDLNGKLLEKKHLGWTGESVSIDEQKKKLLKEMEKIKRNKLGKVTSRSTDAEMVDAKQHILNQMQEDLGRISRVVPKPSLATVIKDSDGNILFFEFPKVKGHNIFHVWVYGNNGGFVCESKFVCDDYDLIINPSRMVFRNGYLYSLQNAKGAKGIPMRLVRFKLVGE